MMSFEEIVSREGGGRQGTVDLDAFLAGGEGEMEEHGFTDGFGAVGGEVFPKLAESNTPKKGGSMPVQATPGSPQSFNWSQSSVASPVPESKGKDQNEQGRVDTIRSATAEEDMFASTHDVSSRPFNALTDWSSTFTLHTIRPRMQSAVDFLLRHLVFTAAQKTEFRYSDLYRDGGRGLSFGSGFLLGSTSMMSLGTIDFGDDEMVPEGLHLMLREVFKLDAVLMVELCAGMSMGMKGVMTGNPKNKLKILLSGLYDVHCHLLPTSRALFDVEKEMGKLTTAQAMVVIRDQVMLQRVTAKDRRDSRMFFPGLYRNESLQPSLSRWGGAGEDMTFVAWLNGLVNA